MVIAMQVLGAAYQESAMSMIIAAKSDGNAVVDNFVYRSVMSLIMAAECDGNRDVGNGKYRSAMSKILAVGNAGVENGKY